MVGFAAFGDGEVEAAAADADGEGVLLEVGLDDDAVGGALALEPLAVDEEAFE